MSEEFFVVVVGIMPNQGLGTMTKCLMKLLPKIPQNPMKYEAKLPNWPKHVGICWQKSSYPASIYPTRTIRHHGLYIYYPVLENHFFVSETYVLMYGQYSRAIYNQERVMMACIW